MPLLPLTSPKVACTDSYKLEPDCVVQTTQYGVHCVFLACVFTDFIKQSFASKYPPMITLRKTGKSQCFKKWIGFQNVPNYFAVVPEGKIK